MVEKILKIEVISREGGIQSTGEGISCRKEEGQLSVLIGVTERRQVVNHVDLSVWHWKHLITSIFLMKQEQNHPLKVRCLKRFEIIIVDSEKKNLIKNKGRITVRWMLI